MAPDCLLCLGLAPHGFLRLETHAANAALPEEDVDGARPQLGDLLELLPGAPQAYATTLPVARLERRLAERRAVARQSDATPEILPAWRYCDAGTYLCNATFYRARHFLNELVPYIGFVHVPPIAEGAADAGVPPDVFAASLGALVDEIAAWMSESIS